MTTNHEQQYARRMARGTILTHLYRLQDLGLNDPATPRSCSRHGFEVGLRATGTLPPEELVINALQWLEGKDYAAVDWAMDNHRAFESVTITQKGIDLYEDKRARQIEPGMLLQPRR